MSRPLPVTILAWIYIAIGIVGFVYHVSELPAAIWIELLRLLAIVSGVFLLRGQDWARWLAIAWIALHVVVSAFHSLPEFAMHCLFCALITWYLLRPEAQRYFRPSLNP